MQDRGMKCPDCGADVDPEQDFCLECAEPIAGVKPAAAAPRPATSGTAPSSGSELRRMTSPETAKAKAKVRMEEPEPVRCPGCGMKSLRERCPSCGTRLRPSED